MAVASSQAWPQKQFVSVKFKKVTCPQTLLAAVCFSLQQQDFGHTIFK